MTFGATKRGRLMVAWGLMSLAPACIRTDADPLLSEGRAGAAGSESGGSTFGGNAGTSTGGTSSVPSNGGSGGQLPTGGTSNVPSNGGASTVGTSSATGGTSSVDPVAQWVESGKLGTARTNRPDFGGLVVATDGNRRYLIESRRDITKGPFDLPWRSRFRLAAYEGESLLWAYVVDPDDLLGDVVVHPSGELTVAWESYADDQLAYRLVRLSRDGTPVNVTKLSPPKSIPFSDFHSTEVPPLLRMKSAMADATTAGWVRLIADGENVVCAILSYVDTKVGDEWSNRLAMAIEALDWFPSGYVEHWARLVEGTHSANPAVWAYDELRWREQAVRPFLAYDPSMAEWIVGRAWNDSRCAANRRVFAEFTATDCALSAVNSLENERFPLAVTRFSKTGERLGTRILASESDAAEQVPFALLAKDGKYIVAGSIVRMNEDGSKHTYPDANGYVDYDGYLGVYSKEGLRLAMRDVNLGRGDVLAALRPTTTGFVAVGSSGWDRWQGGMSISRGADPLFAWVSTDNSRIFTRSFPLSDGSRHYGLHDVGVISDQVVAVGFADAPMTHSADSDPNARTFGRLELSLGSAH